MWFKKEKRTQKYISGNNTTSYKNLVTVLSLRQNLKFMQFSFYIIFKSQIFHSFCSCRMTQWWLSLCFPFILFYLNYHFGAYKWLVFLGKRLTFWILQFLTWMGLTWRRQIVNKWCCPKENADECLKIVRVTMSLQLNETL